MGLITVNDNVKILSPDVGPDVASVLGAMVSRAPNFARRWEQLVEANGGEADIDWQNPPQKVKDFLGDNLGNYGHASIADMAACWVYVDGLGWPAAWMVEDTPLFTGQEMSTRAVDSTKVPGAREICRGAPADAQEFHERWLAVFTEAKDRAELKGGYKFDQVRWALPGTVRAGVVMTSVARVGIRHAETIQSVPGMEFLANDLIAGYAAAAPETTKAVQRGPRSPASHWTPTLYTAVRSLRTIEEGVTVEPENNKVLHRDDIEKHGYPARTKAKSHLDPSYTLTPRWLVSIRCSVAAARDWHRHRPCMPWIVQPVQTSARHLVMAPWADHNLLDEIDSTLVADTSAAFRKRHFPNGPDGLRTPWRNLYYMPYGSELKLTCIATLPQLVYMAELRHGVPNANFEYKAQAAEILRQMARTLGPTVAGHLGLGDWV